MKLNVMMHFLELGCRICVSEGIACCKWTTNAPPPFPTDRQTDRQTDPQGMIVMRALFQNYAQYKKMSSVVEP